MMRGWPVCRRRFLFLPAASAAAAVFVFACALSAAQPVDTRFLEQAWPREKARVYEVGRHPVRWRQRLDKKEGIFAGVRFAAPGGRQAVWHLANDYRDVGSKTPGVSAVRILDEGPNRHVIELDVKILWKRMTLRFEVEQQPPHVVRFRWQDERFGEFLGVCTFEEPAADKAEAAAQTRMELSTWFKAKRPVPMRLLLGVERVAMLSAVREFLKECESL